MIQRKDLLAFNFYKKEKFTGSYLGMRYLIQKATEGERDIFQVFTWPGPYNFACTDENLREVKCFPFAEDSLNDITDHLNSTYEAGKEKWPTRIYS